MLAQCVSQSVSSVISVLVSYQCDSQSLVVLVGVLERVFQCVRECFSVY